MQRFIALSAILATSPWAMTEVLAQSASSGINNIETAVIIYAENRSLSPSEPA